VKEDYEKIHLMLDKAELYLESANDEFDSFRFGIASSQAYYCIFHAMSAALYSIGLTYSKHSGVISSFSEHYIKTGIFDKDFGPIIRRIQKRREVGDYSYIEMIGDEEAETDIKDANKLLKLIKQYLSRE